MSSASPQETNLRSTSRGSDNGEPQELNWRGKDSEVEPHKDPLAAAFSSLFVNVAKIVQSQLQCDTESLELLERMNLRTADEYNEFGDFAAGLRVFVERLKLKSDSFQQFSQQVDEIEHEVSELEGAVSFLNNHTSALESKLRWAYTEGLID
ncbi:hypothetical protein L7F22_030225 [Adiantum nelumboides]|nr:hypothetical protein [Adiantum nelumboides]